MYIGSTSVESISGIYNNEQKTLNVVPGLLKIINEIIDNSVDEYIRTNGKFANKIDVNIASKGLLGSEVTVIDNGRGIPVEQVDGQWRPTLAWMKARAGTNFSDDENRVTMGMNGVGSYCANVFSKSFIGETYDGKKQFTLICNNNGELVDETVKNKKSGTTYTKVSFQPDMVRFEGRSEISEEEIEVIKDRLNHLAVCFPDIEFKLNGKKIAFKNLTQLRKQYGDSALSHEDDAQKLIIANSGDDQEFKFISYVNGLNIKNGGSHIDYITGEIIEHLRPMIKKKHKIDVLPNQIKQHLLVVSYITGVKNLKFDSQTKERITNTKAEISKILTSDHYEKLAKQILNKPELIDPIIQAILAKKELAERLALARKQKKIKKAVVVNHIEAQHTDPEKKTLFITEGLSAIGQLLGVRDTKTVGGYPLKGKILNVTGMKPVDILKNKEISELMAIIGLQFGQKATNLNYGKIAILTDADVDGGQIACLLINLFSHWKELFDQDRVAIVQTPIVIARKGKQQKMFYSLDDYKKASLSGWEINYCKGLGTLDRDTYSDIINNPKLINVKADQDSMLDVAFGKDSQKRKDWLHG
jgi:DNA topoisomerase-2